MATPLYVIFLDVTRKLHLKTILFPTFAVCSKCKM
ncbi:MAG: hypothetical protein JWR38_4840 [Mucilaginibacter sp.]|nr:hypothetical protein [Mucilaginibacter sp.]